MNDGTNNGMGCWARIYDGLAAADERRSAYLDRVVKEQIRGAKEKKNTGRPFLTDDEVRDVRARRARGEQLAEIAERYGTTKETISSAVRGRTYRHVRGTP